jgi:hypothetical protein
MDDINTLSDVKYKMQLFGLISALVNSSDKFSVRDVEIAFRIYNDRITHNLDINDPTIYGTGADREIPKKAFDRAIKILLKTQLFVKKRDVDKGTILMMNPDGSRPANEWLAQRADTMVKDLQKIFKDPDKIKHFELDKITYKNRQGSITKDAHAENPRNIKNNATKLNDSSSKPQ